MSTSIMLAHAFIVISICVVLVWIRPMVSTGMLVFVGICISAIYGTQFLLDGTSRARNRSVSGGTVYTIGEDGVFGESMYNADDGYSEQVSQFEYPKHTGNNDTQIGYNAIGTYNDQEQLCKCCIGSNQHHINENHRGAYCYHPQYCACCGCAHRHNMHTGNTCRRNEQWQYNKE